MKKVYPLDLAESYGFAHGFARGKIIELIAKVENSIDQIKDINQAAWYLARFITMHFGKDAANQALESFQNGIDHG